MMFEKKKITSRKFKTKYTKKRKYTKKKKTQWIWKFLLISIIWFIVFGWVGAFIMYNKYIKDLPSVSQLENLEIAEASTIYDRNGKELYKIFKEKRTYVWYDQINKNMVNALVAWEDKRFWENPGIDVIWLVRAWLYYISGKTGSPGGTSTLTQQLVRNTIIANERTIERKIKEMYLAVQISKKLSKEKVIELYLNKIEFWSNAFGIEQAAKTFFGKSAIDLNILESSMLASLPKTPTGLSPYNYPDRLVWYPYIYPEGDEDSQIQVLSKKSKDNNIEMVNHLTKVIDNFSGKDLNGKLLICWVNPDQFKININVDKDGCSVRDYSELLHILNGIQLNIDGNMIEYSTWRKDFILGRMLEDKYITFDEYKEAILNSIWFEFKEPKQAIKAPHFVFYVKEYLEKEYGKEVVAKWWLQIYTTLDLDLQEKAEEIVKKQADSNKIKYSANNASLISIDNKTWWIVAMVGWRDYFDIENKWNVNVTTSKLQPGSIFKPFVYSIATFKEAIWSKTPVYDVKTKFPNYEPSNFDWKFKWKMDLSSALNYSRNIPAIKMVYLAGGENSVVKFMKALWVESLKENAGYWASIGLGTGEMTPLELAKAYSVYANLGKKKEISPILKILDSKWITVFEQKESEWESVMSDWQAFLLNHILSDTSTRPEFWNRYLSLKWRKVAAKTGTSTKQYIRGGKKVIYPANLWTAGYTPQYTTVAWSWNTDWKELNFKWNWLEWAGPIWRDYMEFAHKWLPAESWKRPSSVKSVNISNVSWKLANPENPSNEFIIESLFINSPTEYDNSFWTIEIDALCNGLVTDKTPDAAKKTVTLLQFSSLRPEYKSWEDPVQEWSRSDKAKELYWNTSNLVTKVRNEECSRSGIPSNIVFNSNITEWHNFIVWDNNIELGYRSNNPVIKLQFLFGWKLIDEVKLDNKKEWIYAWKFNIPTEYISSSQKLTIRVIDSLYNSSDKTQNVKINKKDDVWPEIVVTNPSDLNIKVYKDEFFNLRFRINDISAIKTTNIYIDDKLDDFWIAKRVVVHPIHWKDLELWFHTVKIESTDEYSNTWIKKVTVEVISR